MLLKVICYVYGILNILIFICDIIDAYEHNHATTRKELVEFIKCLNMVQLITLFPYLVLLGITLLFTYKPFKDTHENHK
jgi:hypothetical protein